MCKSHRSFQPILPCGNKFLQQKWDQTYYDDHKKLIKAAKPMVDSKPPPARPHVTAKLKKLQVREKSPGDTMCMCHYKKGGRSWGWGSATPLKLYSQPIANSYLHSMKENCLNNSKNYKQSFFGVLYIATTLSTSSFSASSFTQCVLWMEGVVHSPSHYGWKVGKVCHFQDAAIAKASVHQSSTSRIAVLFHSLKGNVWKRLTGIT